ncbi:hypothetical protein [Streptomyces sp. NPDC059783]|uniref:hypothetical protein n=1 Tax=Streptomyces sp. NPDC059783 TaxID=3346944 RepID=UPI0036485944
MRCMRGVGVVVAGVAAAAVLSGCGGDGGGAAKSAASSPPVSSVDPEPEATVEEPEYPDTPEGDLDRLADGKGWVVDDLYASASEFVTDICESLPESAVDGSSRPQWLVESGNLDGDGKAVLLAGVPKLCPDWTPVLKQAVSGRYDRWFGDGTYVVSSRTPTAEDAEEDVQLMPPGTYRTAGALAECYWERTSRSGAILANSFATSAQEIRVTVRASDGQFTSRGCGVWKPVK